MKLLIVTPSYRRDGKIQVEKKLGPSIFKQKTKHQVDWFIPTEDLIKNQSNLEEMRYNLANKLNLGRRLALSEAYAALRWLSADHYLCKDNIIETMLGQMWTEIGFGGHYIVSAPVRARAYHGHHIQLMTYNSKMVGSVKVGVDATLEQLSEWYKLLKWGVPFEVAGGGLPIIHRHVLERVTFRQELSTPFRQADEPGGVDVRFFSDAAGQGFKTLIVPVDVAHVEEGDTFSERKEYRLDEEFYHDTAYKIIRGEMLKDILNDYARGESR